MHWEAEWSSRESPGQSGPRTLCVVRRCVWVLVLRSLCRCLVWAREATALLACSGFSPLGVFLGLQHTLTPPSFDKELGEGCTVSTGFCMAPSSKGEGIYHQLHHLPSRGGGPSWLGELVNLWGIGCCACPGTLLSPSSSQLIQEATQST